MLNTATLEILWSQNETEPPYNAAPWEVLGDTVEYNRVAAIPFEYREQPLGPGTPVQIMDAAGQAAVDAAVEAASKTGDADEIDVSGSEGRGYARQMRALLHVGNQRSNYNTNRCGENSRMLVALLDEIANGTGSLAALRTAVGALRWSGADGLQSNPTPLPTDTRSLPDAKQDFKDRINNGEVDS